MWACLFIDNPIHDFCEYYVNDTTEFGYFNELANDLLSSSNFLSEYQMLWDEIRIFLNIKEKYKMSQKSAKCTQKFQKVGSCLKKIANLDLTSACIQLRERIVENFNATSTKSIYTLPSCQQLEYILIRIQTAVKLICEVLNFSEELFCSLIQTMKIGHLISILLMATASTARIFFFMKSLLIQLIKIYENLYKWRKKLKEGRWKWPVPLKLPENLETWLTPEEAEHLKSSKTSLGTNEFLESLLRNDSTINDINIVDFESQAEENHLGVTEEDNSNVDYGVPISRSEMKDMSQTKTNKLEKDTCLTNSDSSSSKEKKKISKLSGRKFLWNKIKVSENIDALEHMWNNFDDISYDLFPCSKKKARIINKLFIKAKYQESKLHKSNSSNKAKKKKYRLLVLVTSIKFAYHVTILSNKKAKLLLEKVNNKTKNSIKQK